MSNKLEVTEWRLSKLPPKSAAQECVLLFTRTTPEGDEAYRAPWWKEGGPHWEWEHAAELTPGGGLVNLGRGGAPVSGQLMRRFLQKVKAAAVGETVTIAEEKKEPS